MGRHRYRALCSGVSLFMTTGAQAALIDNGGGLIYDDVLNITWAQPDTTLRTWNSANAYAASLTLGGVDGWRLPYVSVAAGEGPLSASPIDCFGATELDCRDNEMGYMFYHNLGGSVYQPIVDSGHPDLALFPSLLGDSYWSATELDSSRAHLLNFEVGFNGSWEKDGGPYNMLYYAWAVHDGNISAVPVPSALWLLGTGLLGLLGVGRGATAAV